MNNTCKHGTDIDRDVLCSSCDLEVVRERRTKAMAEYCQVDVEQVKALIQVLDIPDDEIEDIAPGYDDNELEYGGGEYLVLTDEEAKERVAEYIEESLWAFNSSFLAAQTDLPYEVFQALSEKYEDGNDAIRSLIEKCGNGMNDFVEEAIAADGRGHFIAHYDFEELEAQIDGEFWYVYRTN